MRVVYSSMRLFFILAFCSLCVAGCGDDDYGHGGALDFSTDDGGEDDGGLDLSAVVIPDLTVVVHDLTVLD
jgi:hypothetical protein